MASIFKRKSDGPWYIAHTYPDGRRVFFSTKCTDKASAKEMAADLETEAFRQKKGLESAADAQRLDANQRTLREHFDDFVQNLRDDHRSSTHVKDHERIFSDFIECTDALRLSDITKRLVVDYLERRRVERKNSARSLNRVQNALSSFCRWVVKKNRMDGNPIAEVEEVDETVDQRRKRRALTDAELHALFELGDKRGRGAFYRTCYFAALRRSEIERLCWSDLDLDAATLTIRGSKARGRVDVVRSRQWSSRS